MTPNASTSNPLRERCKACGYPGQSDADHPCSECGSTSGALTPFTRNELRKGLRQLALNASMAWIALLVPMLVAQLSVRMTHGLPLFIMAGMAMFVMLFAAPIWGVGVAWQWTPWTLHAIWTWRNGDVGPWSRWSVRARVFLGLVLIQWTIAAMAVVISAAQAPGYPGGWP